MSKHSASLWHGLLLIEDAQSREVLDLSSDGRTGVGTTCIVIVTRHGDDGEVQIELTPSDSMAEPVAGLHLLVSATLRVASGRLCLRTTEGDTVAEAHLPPSDAVSVRVEVDDVSYPSVIRIEYR